MRGNCCDGNFPWPKFPKRWLRNVRYNTKREKMFNQFLLKLILAFGHQAKEPKGLSVLYFLFDLNLNISNLQYVYNM